MEENNIEDKSGIIAILRASSQNSNQMVMENNILMTDELLRGNSKMVNLLVELHHKIRSLSIH